MRIRTNAHGADEPRRLAVDFDNGSPVGKRQPVGINVAEVQAMGRADHLAGQCRRDAQNDVELRLEGGFVRQQRLAQWFGELRREVHVLVEIVV